MCIGIANGGKIMTPQKALNRLDETVTGNLEWKIVLSNALKKQIPKKPHQEEFELGEYCPNCEYIFDGFPNYCEYCGQRIDWSDTE